MSEIYRSSGKSWRSFSNIITAIIIVSLLFPFTANTAFAAGVPQPLYPADFANTTSVTDPPLGIPSFSWSAVTGANIYRLQVDNEIGFNLPITLDITTHNTTYTPQSTAHL